MPTPGYRLSTPAPLAIGRKLQVVGTLRNLLDDRYYSNAGPRWVYAPGMQGTMAIALVF